MRALLSIDYTNDFVATDGKLTTGEAGQAIEQALVDRTKDYFQQGDFIVFAIDGQTQTITTILKTACFPLTM
jgi:nicotinamidase-related amidase